jgi:hypothetical protein
MASYTGTPIDDASDYSTNVVEVGVEDGDNILDLHASDADKTVELRINVAEALALISSLSAAIAVALANGATVDDD